MNDNQTLLNRISNYGTHKDALAPMLAPITLQVFFIEFLTADGNTSKVSNEQKW